MINRLATEFLSQHLLFSKHSPISILEIVTVRMIGETWSYKLLFFDNSVSGLNDGLIRGNQSHSLLAGDPIKLREESHMDRPQELLARGFEPATLG